MDIRVLKRSLLAFWALWLFLVLGSNLCDALKELEVLDKDWAFASGNYRAVAQTTARYGASAAVNSGLFAGVLAWEAVAALLFLRACINFNGPQGPRLVHGAFAACTLLWAAFLIAEEICVSYAIEAVHWRLLIAQLACLLVIDVVPEAVRMEKPVP